MCHLILQTKWVKRHVHSFDYLCKKTVIFVHIGRRNSSVTENKIAWCNIPEASRLNSQCLGILILCSYIYSDEYVTNHNNYLHCLVAVFVVFIFLYNVCFFLSLIRISLGVVEIWVVESVAYLLRFQKQRHFLKHLL